MPTGSLFDEEPIRGSGLKIASIALAALVFLAGAGYTAFVFSTPEGPNPEVVRANAIRDDTVIFLSQGRFAGEESNQQIFGRGRVVKYNAFAREAYFTFPETAPEEFDQFKTQYFVDPAKLEFGEEKDGTIELGKYNLTRSPGAFHFFRTPLENVRIDTKQTLSFQYSTVNYTASLDELRNLTNNSQLYGGRMLARAPQRRDKPTIIFANHGIMVAKPEEPTLKRLTDELLKGIEGREAKIQRLVDFVSGEIEYSYTEALMNGELLKRPSETLMTRSGDCSNKTILLASLLEQIGEEYILLYMPRHITVAVPQGAFENNNKLDFTWANKPWMIAETTLAGFQIGQTRVNDTNQLAKVDYVQDPKLSEVIFDASSFEVLKFF